MIAMVTSGCQSATESATVLRIPVAQPGQFFLDIDGNYAILDTCGYALLPAVVHLSSLDKDTNMDGLEIAGRNSSTHFAFALFNGYPYQPCSYTFSDSACDNRFVTTGYAGNGRPMLGESNAPGDTVSITSWDTARKLISGTFEVQVHLTDTSKPTRARGYFNQTKPWHP